MLQHEQLVNEGQRIVRSANQAFIDLDVEADGKPGFGSLLSIGAVSPWGETFYAELKPSSSLYVPSQREFCEAHGLERKRLEREGQEPRNAILNLAQWTNEIVITHDKQSAVLAAFNASFDYPWIDLAMLETNTPNPFGIAGYCIKSIALALSPDYDWQDTSKGRLPTAIIPDGNFTHNALEDARYQQNIHFALAAMLGRAT